jgi:hypothetical protein
MTTISNVTVAELDGLPVGAEFADRDGWTWIKHQSGRWQPLAGPGSSAKRVLELWSPITITAHSTRWANAFEQLHRRITRDLNWEASEFAAPEDERWARTLDDLRQFADDLWDKTEGDGS